MRAVRIDDGAVRLVSDAPEPQPAPGEALIKPSRVLLSPLDAALAWTAKSGFSGVLGHQFVGVIRKINVPPDAGPAAAARKGWSGRRVVASPTIACAACDLCRGGLSNHCRARKVMGVHGQGGCLADLFTLPLASLYAVPDKVTDDQAVFAVLLASAAHAVNMLRSEGHSYITVLGDSALALVTAQALARKNATVRLLSSREDRARLCAKWGIKQRALEEPGRRQDQDVVVDCTGSAAGLRLALQMVRPRGMVLLKSPMAVAPCPAGRPFPEADAAWAPGVDLTPAIVNEVQLIGARDGPVADALMMLAEGAVDVTGLVTRRAKMEDAVEALRAAGDAAQVGVVVEF